ncbi:MAG TPA: co-chaperone GroES family protein [Bacteroidales bacterium]|nr:chaperonin [Bacteroidales bacterium]HOU95088.1 co-chaperone GroES family protein [Bacteroidales bacterium]HQG36422.1 co-chaperone GroES family protein [Bacteroidales bacterium]HQG53672.1 co-chaperone GroES family protein [Bacteroidales bacterium]HQJ20508.1 co-chaperone GroES family protein [Bacteroidales bacterium]
MVLNLDDKDLQKLIVIGDRILIKPKMPQSKTQTGLFLPPGVTENEKVQVGYVLKVGPGYPIPSVVDDEPWKNKSDEPKYIPLQTKVGDQAIYLQSQAIEIEFNNEKYIIVPQSAILLLLRDEGLFE